MSPKRPDVAMELSRLKDFQLATVDYVHRRFYGADPVDRFLVADEVGLGKTLVAKGVIAKTIDHLWDTIDRIDVVYICSSNAIAAQNLRKLRVGVEEQIQHADRLTMLPKVLGSMQGRKINFVSFTPGTSFNLKHAGGGNARERVLLFGMLKVGLRDPRLRAKRWLRFFRGGAGMESFKRQLAWFERHDLGDVPAEMVDAFVRGVREATSDGEPLLDALFECAEDFNYLRKGQSPPGNVSRRRYRLIGALRHALAAASVEKLEPDLVILDEFQRFPALLDAEDEASELAHALFSQPDTKVLLLSATPFKMYTLPDDAEQEDHYKDFIRTVEFLAGKERAATVASSSAALRTAVYAGELAAARTNRDEVQEELRRVMVRTERLASTPDRDGMVVAKKLPGVELLPRDLKQYASDQAVAGVVNAHDVFEYWRSAPYLFEFMDTYKVKRDLEAAAGVPNPALADAFRIAGARLTWDHIRSFRPLDPGNAKLRGLVRDVLDRGAWKLAWIPPSLPYYELGGAYAEPELRTFTKRLVFSAWAVVPKAVASVLSYEAERRLVTTDDDADRRPYDAARQTALLTFQQSAGRLTGMPVLGLLYPSTRLAAAGDPTRVANELGATFPISRVDYLGAVRANVATLVAGLPTGPADGRVDDRWYWAAPILLDRVFNAALAPSTLSFGFADSLDDDGGESAFTRHLAAAEALDPAELGRQPDDLLDILTILASAGPGVAALRAVARVLRPESGLTDSAVRDGASIVAWAFRAMFNRPEITAMVRQATDSEDSYWRAVLSHCLDGGLQAVLDEYLHVLFESEGLFDKPLSEQVDALCQRADDALSLRASTSNVHMFNASDSAVIIDRSHHLRNHLAIRFGRGTSEDEKTAQREKQIQTAYNSPFWPFVLASTSVGQEGLDFHQYSHAVVHWNLPGNPVDLEQREGRVHRFKGHAVRKNVADRYGSRPEVAQSPDPWTTAFQLAAVDRPQGETEIYPYWICSGSHAIERYAPVMPLSKEAYALKRLIRSVGAYRMAIGQPRQEELLAFLGSDLLGAVDIQLNLGPTSNPSLGLERGDRH